MLMLMLVGLRPTDAIINIDPIPLDTRQPPFVSWGMIYFLGHIPSNAVKIGYTENVARRLHTLAAAHPDLDALVLYGVWEGEQQTEHDLHIEYGEYHLRGEWFKIKGSLREFVEEFPHPQPLTVVLNEPPGSRPKYGKAANVFWLHTDARTLQRNLSNPRHLRIALAYASGTTMETLGDEEGCSRQRIYQILKLCETRCLSFPRS